MSTQGGALGLIALKGSIQKPAWITSKSQNQAHWMFKSHSQCDLSTLATDYRGCDPQGGPIWTEPWHYKREYKGNVANPISLARITSNEFKLQTPYGQVPNHTGGSVPAKGWCSIGPDYNVPSEDYLWKMHEVAAGHSLYDAADKQQGLFTRVVGAKHTFFFTNYLRHPVQVLFVYDASPDGTASADPSPNVLMDALSRSAFSPKAVGTAAMDPDAINRIKASSESIIIPPTLDNNDMGVTVKHDVKFSPKEYDPDTFSVGPMGGVNSSGGLWRRVDVARFSLTYEPADSVGSAGTLDRRSPWLDDSPDSDQVNPARYTKASVRMFMRLVTPHGHVMGTEAGAMRDGNDLQSYRAVDMHVKSSFINEVMGVGLTRNRLNGVQAEGSNTDAAT